jgi:hypothetical protein
MRSICSRGMASSSAVPLVDEPTRSPSTSTSVRALFAPRRNTPLVDPGPPLVTISTPGWRSSRATSPPGPARAIFSAPINVRSASKSVSGCSARSAVTTMGGCSFGRRQERPEQGKKRQPCNAARHGGTGKNESSMCSACAALPRTASGSKQRGGKPVRAEKGRPASVRTSPPAMRQDSEMRFGVFPFAGRSPDSSVQRPLVWFRPRAACLPIPLQ